MQRNYYSAMLNDLELTGRTRSHIVQLDGYALHHQVVHAYTALREAARFAGFDLYALSSFRDFPTQLSIWNKKMRGEKPAYDSDGVELNPSSLSEEQLIHSILRWSALPGASRHHWGTEIDVIDKAVLPENYRVKLLPDEYGHNGIFEQLNLWLEQNLHNFGFFRPYASDKGGVCTEPWHVSYAPISNWAHNAVSPELIQQALMDCEILGKDKIMDALPDIFNRYIVNINVCPASVISVSHDSNRVP